MSTVARVRFYAPSLASVADGTIETALEYAGDGRLHAVTYGTRIADAVALLAAHWLVLQQTSPDDRTRGAVTGESLGDASLSYAGFTPTTLDQADLMRTNPGCQLLALRSSRATATIAVLT